MVHFVLHAHILRSSLSRTNRAAMLQLLTSLSKQIVRLSADDGGCSQASKCAFQH